MRASRAFLAAALVAVVAPAACYSYDDRPYDDPARVDAPPADCSSIEGFAYVRDTILPTCAGDSCHSANNQQGLVVLEGENAYANVVGVSSKFFPSMKLVEPGRPSRSFFFRKISGTQESACEANDEPPENCGARMPLGAWDESPQEWLDATQAWIACGANPP